MPEPRTLASDTSSTAERLQFEIWSRMTPAAKFAALVELTAFADAVAEAGIRRLHPHADDREVFLRRAARVLDAETMRKVYGWHPDESG
jgi:hypothetical protein